MAMSTTLTCADLLTPSGSMRIDVRANMGLWCYQLNSNQYDCDMYYAHAPNSGRNTLCLHPTDGGNTCDASVARSVASGDTGDATGDDGNVGDTSAAGAG